ncbi:hypothetical protein [Campylobacter armoricus]|uniref:hypothetical protein n=1 Tax=Campylobacter armoricus TaxID=2505970 RepID=UPI0011174730|nr:hypothetical protein [Campylobacter armoricus]
MRLTRRKFLKGLVATSAIASVNPLMAASEGTKFYDTCAEKNRILRFLQSHASNGPVKLD